MKVLVDTSIWTLAFRRPVENLSSEQKTIVSNLTTLIEDLRVVFLGPIRQEILSGISNERQFSQLKEKLRAFYDFPITTQDYERAAELYTTCRKNGIQGSHIDFLLCAVSERNELLLFTTDQDFKRFSTCINLRFYEPYGDGSHPPNT